MNPEKWLGLKGLKTRGGDKVRITGIRKDFSYPVRGVIEGFDYEHRWTADGRWFSGITVAHNFDLMLPAKPELDWLTGIIKTRDGRTVVIDSIDHKHEYPVHGFIRGENIEGGRRWTLEGVWLKGEFSQIDLIHPSRAKAKPKCHNKQPECCKLLRAEGTESWRNQTIEILDDGSVLVSNDDGKNIPLGKNLAKRFAEKYLRDYGDRS